MDISLLFQMRTEQYAAGEGVARIPLVTWDPVALGCVCVRVCLPRIQLSPARVLRAAKAGTTGANPKGLG